MTVRRDIDWRAPTLMVGAFLAASALALSHHFYYLNLNHKAVGLGSFYIPGTEKKVTSQQLHLTAGTAFSFGFNTCLGLTMSSAYTQLMWSTLNSRRIHVRTADAFFSLLSNFLGLFNPRLWRTSPLATVTACATWLLPVAIVFPPGSITVALAKQQHSSLMQVPTVDFTSMNFASLPLTAGPTATGDVSLLNVSVYGYQGPQYAVSKVAVAASALGILPISPPENGLNVSWAQESAAPAIKCGSISAELQIAIAENLLEVFALILNASEVTRHINPWQSFGYVAWTPDQPGNVKNSVPFVTNNASWALRSASLGPQNSPNDTIATLYIGTFPNLLDVGVLFGSLKDSLTMSTLEPFLVNSNILQCQLYNVSQYAEYRINNGNQTVFTSTNHTYNAVPALSGLNGTIPRGGLEVPSAPIPGTSGETIDPIIMRTFAYQSIMDAFGRVLVGTIGLHVYGQGALQAVNTSVMSTTLSDAKEIKFLRDWYFDRGLETPNLETAVWEGGYPFDGVSITSVPPATQPLAEALEELFRNITISLVTSELLQTNSSSPYRPNAVDVIFTPFVNTYTYAPVTLWAAYGTALAVGLLSATLGLLAMVRNRASYSNEFSSVLRATRLATLSTDLQELDTDGRDPLPGYLARATITLQNHRRKSDHQYVSLESLQPKSVDHHAVEMLSHYGT